MKAMSSKFRKNEEMKKQLEKKNEDFENTNMIQVEIIRVPNSGNSGGSNRVPKAASVDAPEKKLTIFALRLAIIEKTASSLGQLAFVWATVVLLGGFATSLKPKDFWFTTVILVAEGARLFTRTGELEWEHQLTGNFLTLVRAAMRPLYFASRSNRILANTLQQLNGQASLPQQRRIFPADVPLLPYPCWVFVSKNINRLLYWLQIFAAAASVTLSLMRLGQQDYGHDAQKNERSALNVFYSLALLDAFMFLLERGYWIWRIEYGKLVEEVSVDYGLDSIGISSLRRFFYDAYSKCISGSIFDGLKMDLISFAKDLLNSDSPDEQIIGANVLQIFVKNTRFADNTLRNIGSCTPVIERLIEMLNWKDPAEKDIRCAASEIVSKLASRKHHALRVAAIPGAIESIASLPNTGDGSTNRRPYEASPKADMVDKEDYEFSAFNLLGLLILKRLAKDQDNCWKIGNVRGLLEQIIGLTSVSASLLRDSHTLKSRIKIVQRALKVVKILTCATGKTGKLLRRDILECVYSVSNIRELLQYGESYSLLQILGLEILTNLGMNEEARERIGATGNMLTLIIEMFFRPKLTKEVEAVCNEAGEALAMLIIDSRSNCDRMLKERNDVVRRLVKALDDPKLIVNGARILRGLCASATPKRTDRLQIVAEAMPIVLKKIMEEKDKENEKLLEVSIGLAIQIFKFSNPQVCENEIEKAGMKDEDFIKSLVEILRRYENPESKVPRIRIFVIELTIALMKYECKYIELLRDFKMEQVLIQTAKTTYELECFKVFSGNVGLGRHEVMISTLIDIAIELLDRDSNSG